MAETKWPLFWRRHSSISFLTSGEIWIRYTYLKWQSCFGCYVLRVRQNDAPFKMIYIFEINYPVWNWVIVFFFIFNFSVFLNFHTEIYCIIVSSCTERGSNAVHRMTSLLGNVFPNAAPVCGPWVTVGLIPFALFLLLTSVKRHPLSNNQLPVIKFRVGYVHLSLILILKNRKCHKEIAKKHALACPWQCMRSLGFQNFQQCCFRLPDHALDGTTFSGNYLNDSLWFILSRDSSCRRFP